MIPDEIQKDKLYRWFIRQEWFQKLVARQIAAEIIGCKPSELPEHPPTNKQFEKLLNAIHKSSGS